MKQSKIALIASLLLILLTSENYLFAQERGSRGSSNPQARPTLAGNIKGKLIDSETKNPVIRATVTVNDPTTKKQITGGFTDRTGNFNINVNPGNYFIKITFLGYEPREIKDVAITINSLTFDAGTIPLKMSSVMTKEIEVVAERGAIEVGLDRRVINIGQDASNIGGSALDVLANIPSVTVDQDDNISLRGNSNVRVMIDGRVSNLTASEALEQIPSTMVTSVELITNPGARYEAEGTAGIINIVTLRQREDGFNGMVNLNGGVNQVGDPRYNASLAVNWNVGKWNFFTNISGRLGTRSGENERERILYSREDGLPSQFLFQEGDSKSQRQGFRGRIGADYNFNKSNILTYTFNAGARRGQGDNESAYWVLNRQDDLIEYYTREEDNQSPFSTNFEHTLSYKRNFKERGHELYVDLYRNSNINERLTYYNQYDYAIIDATVPDFANSIFSKEKNTSKMDFTGYTAQVDYARPISTNFKLEVGGKYNTRNGDIDNRLEDLVGDNWVENLHRKNRFEFTEHVIASYATGSTKLFDKIRTNIGVRLESTIMDFNSILDTSLSFKNDYTMLFPSVYLAYDFNVHHMMSANFASRMRRPNYWDLNPITNYEDPLNLRKGNPELLPESHYNFELGYLMNYEKSTLTATLFHRYSTDGIELYRDVVLDANGESTDTTLMTPINISTSSRTGFELIYMYKIFDNWKADANFSLYSYSIDATNIDIGTRTAYNWTARINSQLSLFERFLDVTVSANIRSKMLRAQGELNGNWNMDASFRLNFSRNFNISLRLQDIFNTMQWGGFEDIPGVLYSKNTSKFNSRGFVLGLSYRFQDYKQRRDRNLDDGRMEESGD